ncbi:hypothetical protein crov445 [Cafeteria roenbergensis virus]|uniref:Uncharacterized protein n=1 Tax=Cafeteria roenbergensis virus (strain BV-PW1) TaxID=693272 RepID=E3T5L6_CROVB|nr:hypothetical protein crov445 [Cafeteria roenbergensis virus BV-PW1]ADO67479.1 hypothetical protein crov445 [Cafeteria roenbergensis virus BV-PW1]
MEINYNMIIKYLTPAEIISKNEINPLPFNHFKLNKFNYLNFLTSNNFIDSIIYLISNEHFYINPDEMDKSRNEFIKQIKLNTTDITSIKQICKFFKINILILSEKINLYSSENIIDLSLPFIILYHSNNNYYPVYQDNKFIFFYQNSPIEQLLEEDLVVNFTNYQFLDDLNQIIDLILNDGKSIDNTINKISTKINNKDIIDKIDDNINNKIFINNENLDKLEKLKKTTKNNLIIEILQKDSSLKKTNLNKLKKNDLINLLIS